MKHLKLAAILVMSALVMYSCGDSGSDSKNPADSGNGDTGGSSSKGSLTTHSGTNTAVTESNVGTVNQKVTSKSFEIFGRAMSTVKYKTAKPTAQSFNLDGKVNGNNSGYAQVKGTYSINMSGTTVSSYSYNFTCTYYDFADDTTMYLGGQVAYTGTYDLTNMNNIKYDLTFKGGLKFNGDYEGTQDFTTKYSMLGQTVSWTSSTSTTSGGKTFSSTYTYPQ
jgi:hypothetical protein